MCGRYVSPDEAAIERHFHLHPRDVRLFTRRFNVAPTMDIPVVMLDAKTPILTTARWGFIPSWWKQAKPPSRTHLARGEDVWERPMWRTPIRRSRCLIPMEGWYEWRETEQQAEKPARQAKRKQPYFIRPRHDGLVAIAGLCDRWQTAAGEELLSCAVISRAATEELLFVHDRMPVALDEDGSLAWLSVHTDADGINRLLNETSVELRYHAVSLRVNNTRNDDEDLILPDPYVL